MLQELKDQFNSLHANRINIEKTIKNNEEKIDGLKKKLDKYSKLRFIVIHITEQIQQEFKNQVETLVTLATQSVFTENYKFKLIFEERNNQLECRPAIFEDDFEYTPDDDMGGSMVNIISFALRCVLWTYEEPKSRPIIIMDEPMTWMGNLIDKAGKIIRTISHEMGLQIIIVTHIEELKEFADKKFNVVRTNKISTVTEG